MNLTGTTAVVTGAASGIGRALVQQLDRHGVGRLVLLDIDRQGLTAVAQTVPGAEIETHVVDLSDASALEAIFSELAARSIEIDVLFNNAGIPAGTPAWPDTSLERIQSILGTNLMGTVFVTRLALPLMTHKGGAIVNTASTSGLRPYLTGAVYATSKAGVIMFTQSCRDLATTHGVRVNAICPGIVHTPFLEKTGTGGKAADWLASLIETGAMLAPEQVADAAIALACDESLAGDYRVLEAPKPT